MTKAFAVFHLNLGFSSIEKEDLKSVVEKCYYPLLGIIKNTGVPLGIELTGWTLELLEEISPEWVKSFGDLLSKNKCELIASGYSQIIGPLAPYKVNIWNQKLGLDSYKNILGIRPKIVLTNEMAFSNSLVELYKEVKFEGFIMDRDNIRLALNQEGKPVSSMPVLAEGEQGSIMPVLWGDSVLFQKVQQLSHGDISFEDYFDYLHRRIDDGEKLLPIYCNDAEVFDYRPGRFSEERTLNPDMEWKRVEKLFNSIENRLDVKWISPSTALEQIKQPNNDESNKSKLGSLSHPVPVKKQAKYNIARWAVTGRNDIWLNTICHRIAESFIKAQNKNSEDWRKLCEFWSSDQRTHITEKKWKVLKEEINDFLESSSIDSSFGEKRYNFEDYVPLKNFTKANKNFEISFERERTVLKIENKKLSVELNLKRGLTIRSLSFYSHNRKPCIGTLPQGYFSNIKLGADFYSGGLVLESQVKGKRFTDLEHVEPLIFVNKSGDLEIGVEIETIMGFIQKKLTISCEREKIELHYNFSELKELEGSLRIGNITLFRDFFSDSSSISFCNGGKEAEKFCLDTNADHHLPSSNLVSSSGGFGGTTGLIKIKEGKNELNLRWDPSQTAVLPLLQNNFYSPNALTRIFFSMLEKDDTSKKKGDVGSFCLSITPD